MIVVQFPKRPVKRRRRIARARYLAPATLLFVLVIVLALIFSSGPPSCEPYMNC